MSDEQIPPQTPTPIPVTPVLSYAEHHAGGMVGVGRFATVEEAEMRSAELAAEGIRSHVLNGHVSSLGIPYAGLVEVELHVSTDDATRAREILARATSDEWEPGDDSTLPPPMDEQGVPLQLLPAAAFDSVRKMREAQTLLASARITAYLPAMIPRGSHPPGQGDRFVLRVQEQDQPRAQSLLQEESDDVDTDDLHCPRCRSWRVYPVSRFWQSLGSLVGLAPKPVEEVDCLACRYRGPKAEFEAR